MMPALLIGVGIVLGVLLTVSLALYLHLSGKFQMATSAAAQVIVDELNTAAGNIPQLTGAQAQATEDLTAIKTAADGLVSAINAALPVEAPTA